MKRIIIHINLKKPHINNIPGGIVQETPRCKRNNASKLVCRSIKNAVKRATVQSILNEHEKIALIMEIMFLHRTSLSLFLRDKIAKYIISDT